MKQTNLIATIIVLLCCTSCQRRPSTLANCDKAKAENVFTIDIEKESSVEKYSNLFCDIQYVALEETKNSIIGDISRLEVTNSGDLIIFDNRAGSVYRFAPDGKFLNNIGFRGGGEKEYILPWDMKYDPFNDKVLVWDNGRSSILTFQVNGEFINRVQLPWIISTFGIIDKDHLICYMNNGEDIIGDEKGTNYKILKRNGAIVAEFGEYGAEKATFRPMSKKTFNIQQGRCICFPPFSNTLFSAEKDSLCAIATFDLMENEIPQEWLQGQYVDFREKLRKRKDLAEIVSIHETSKYYVLNILKDGPPMLCFIDKDKKKTKKLSLVTINDMYGITEFSYLTQIHQEKLYFAIDPIMFEKKNDLIKKCPNIKNIKEAYLDMKEVLFPAYSRIIGEKNTNAFFDSISTITSELTTDERILVERMAETSNPILQICTLK